MGTGDEQTLRQREEPTASDERSEYFCTKRFNVSIFTVDTEFTLNMHGSENFVRGGPTLTMFLFCFFMRGGWIQIAL